jgi:outer membrane protein assembly factor BamB
MIAVDLATGKVLWKTPNPQAWAMTHVSILPVTVGGTRMYIYCGSGGVAGISAADGRLLWQDTDWIIPTAVVPTPVDIGDGRVFLSGGYGAGAMMLKVSTAAAQTLWRVAPDVFGSDQQTPIYYGGYIYGVISGGELVCLDLNGKQVWRSGSEHQFGLGPYLIAGGMIYVLDDNGTLNLVAASPAGYRSLAQAKILDGPEAWGPLALAGGRLLARDVRKLVCLDVSQGGVR